MSQAQLDSIFDKARTGLTDLGLSLIPQSPGFSDDPLEVRVNGVREPGIAWDVDAYGNEYLWCKLPTDGDYLIEVLAAEPFAEQWQTLILGLQGPHRNPAWKASAAGNLIWCGVHSFQWGVGWKIRLQPCLRQKLLRIDFTLKAQASQCWGWDDSGWTPEHDRFSATRTFFPHNLSAWGAGTDGKDCVLLDPWHVAVAEHFHPTTVEFYADNSPWLMERAALGAKIGQQSDLAIYKLDHAVTKVDPMPTLPMGAMEAYITGVAGSWPWTIMPFVMGPYGGPRLYIPSVLVNPTLPGGDSGSLAVGVWNGRAGALGLAHTSSSAGTWYSVPSIPYYAEWIRSLGVDLEIL